MTLTKTDSSHHFLMLGYVQGDKLDSFMGLSPPKYWDESVHGKRVRIDVFSEQDIEWLQGIDEGFEAKNSMGSVVVEEGFTSEQWESDGKKFEMEPMSVTAELTRERAASLFEFLCASKFDEMELFVTITMTGNQVPAPDSMASGPASICEIEFSERKAFSLQSLCFNWRSDPDKTKVMHEG